MKTPHLVLIQRREKKSAPFGAKDPRQVLDAHASGSRLEICDRLETLILPDRDRFNAFGPNRPSPESLTLSLSRLLGYGAREQSCDSFSTRLSATHPYVECNPRLRIGPARRVIGGRLSGDRATILPTGRH